MKRYKLGLEFNAPEGKTTAVLETDQEGNLVKYKDVEKLKDVLIRIIADEEHCPMCNAINDRHVDGCELAEVLNLKTRPQPEVKYG